MTEVFCEQCGERVDQHAKFCPACGVRQDAGGASPAAEVPSSETQVEHPAKDAGARELGPELAPPLPPPPPPPPPQQRSISPEAAARVEQIGPGAGELASRLAAQLQTPGVIVAGLGGVLAGLAVFGVGVAVAALTNSHSLLDLKFPGDNIVTEGLRQTVGLTLAGISFHNLHGGSIRGTPALFVVFPIAANAIAVAGLSPRTQHLSARTRLIWATATGIPFGLMMLIAAIVAGTATAGSGAANLLVGTIDEPVAGAFLLGVLWGAAGGLLGMRYRLQREDPDALGSVLPSGVATSTKVVSAALRPLAIALVVCGVLGTAAWVTQTLRHVGAKEGVPIRRQRSTLHATFENVLYAGEHPVHFLALGANTNFHKPGIGILYVSGMPFPASKVEKITGVSLSELRRATTLDEALRPAGTYGLFDYRRGLPGWAFIVMLGLMFVPVLLALYAGFAVARVRGAQTPAAAAAWGLTVGPIWALAMVILNALVTKDYFGRAAGDSVFVCFLLGGAVLGALGGFLAAQGETIQERTPSA